MIEVANALSYNQNFILWELSSPDPVLYTCIKSWYFLKDFSSVASSVDRTPLTVMPIAGRKKKKKKKKKKKTKK